MTGKHASADLTTVRIKGLRVVRGHRVVIPGLDLEIRRGQLVGLLGPSGCGKSTLMRSIVGVQQVTAGSVDIFGLPAGGPELRRKIGYLTQQPSIYLDLTVRENLRYFAKVIGIPRGGLSAEVKRLLALVDLADHSSARAGTLSGGEQSRVSLAAALVGSPALLVLDEPTVGLDPVLRRQLWGIFRRLADAGVTMLVSSHVMDEATRCDRLLLMRAGELLADGSLHSVLDATGAADAEQAFLTLVDRAATSVGGAIDGTGESVAPKELS
jgi:ABC-2 type transport system ATP-binding protein